MTILGLLGPPVVSLLWLVKTHNKGCSREDQQGGNMYKLLLTHFFVLCWAISPAQYKFFTRRPFDSLQQGWAGDIKYYNQKIYAVGGNNITDNDTIERRLFLAQFDANGNKTYLVKTDSVPSPTFSQGSYRSVVINEGEVMLCGSVNYSEFVYNPLILQFDTIGKLNTVKEFVTDSADFFKSIVLSPDNGFYVLGVITDSFLTSNDIILYKLDSLLSTEWLFRYGGADAQHPGLINLYVTKDSGVIFACTSGIVYQWEGHIIKVDKYGHLVYDKSSSSALGIGEFDLLDYNEDEGYYLLKRAHFTAGNVTMNMHILKMDTSLQVIWDKVWLLYTGSTVLNDVWNSVRVKDGYVFCGNQNDANRGWVFKLNDAGQTVWEATYKQLPQGANPLYNFCYITGIDTMPDGGFVLSGSTSDSINRQVAFIMRIDSNGCLTADSCEATHYLDITYYPPALTVQVYPNPFSNMLQLKITNTNFRQAEIMIFDLLGRVISHKKIESELTSFETNNWANGMYVWSILEDGQPIKGGKIVKE